MTLLVWQRDTIVGQSSIDNSLNLLVPARTFLLLMSFITSRPFDSIGQFFVIAQDDSRNAYLVN